MANKEKEPESAGKVDITSSYVTRMPSASGGASSTSEVDSSSIMISVPEVDDKLLGLPVVLMEMPINTPPPTTI